MARLQKHKSYTYKTESGDQIEHFKHTIVIPSSAIEKLGWKDGMNLAVVPLGNSLTLKPAKEDEEEE